MQWVFAASAATLFVPVLFHNSSTEDVADVDPSQGATPLLPSTVSPCAAQY